MEWQLLEEPPAEHLLALYFIAQKWWSRPSRTGAGGGDAEPEVWECPYPDVTD